MCLNPEDFKAFFRENIHAHVFFYQLLKRRSGMIAGYPPCRSAVADEASAGWRPPAFFPDCCLLASCGVDVSVLYLGSFRLWRAARELVLARVSSLSDCSVAW